MASTKDQYFSKTLEKGLVILNLFNLDHSFLTLSEISRLSGINKTSTYRLTNTLVQLGYLKHLEQRLPTIVILPRVGSPQKQSEHRLSVEQRRFEVLGFRSWVRTSFLVSVFQIW